MSAKKNLPAALGSAKAKSRIKVVDGVPCRYLSYIEDANILGEDCTKLMKSPFESSEEEGECASTGSESQMSEVSFGTTGSSSGRSCTNYADASLTDRKLKRRHVVYSDNDTNSSTDFKRSKRHRSESKKKIPEYLHEFYPRETVMTKNKDVSDVPVKAIKPSHEYYKYPIAPEGVFRKKIKDISYIQEEVEKRFTSPCPGLERVLEIRGIKETTYYCTLCDSPCSSNSIMSHLKGYKHMLQCLNLFNPNIYKKIIDEPKYKVEKQVLNTLRLVQLKEGMGKISVEKDFLDKDYFEHVKDRRTFRSRSRSRYPDKDTEFNEYYNSTTIPDITHADFYCKICDAHMNNSEMWENHIRGRRHLTNIKKNPGALPSKLRSVRVPHARPLLMHQLKDIEEPIVGLNHIQEIQNFESGKEMYKCFLCGSCLTTTIIDHILSQTHRIKYLEHIRYEELERYENVSRPSMFNLVEEMCIEVERKYGPGCPEVYITQGAGV